MSKSKPYSDINLKEKVSGVFCVLAILEAICMLLANVMAFKLWQLGPLVVPAGTIIFPIVYIVGDVITEVYGFIKAKWTIWFGFGASLIGIVTFQFAIWVPSPSWFQGAESFAQVLGTTPRVFLGGFIAYLVGSFMNAYVLSKLKVATEGKRFFERALGSTLVGEFFDSLIFISIAFAFTMSFKELGIMILSQTFLKTMYEIIIYPVLTNVVKLVKCIEQTDTYDRGIKYRPI